MSTINDNIPPIQQVVPAFSWSSSGTLGNFIENGVTFPPAGAQYAAQTTALNVAITFTAAATTIPPGFSVVQYRWDFGDGVIGYGPSIQHTYKVLIPEAAATLTCTDNLGHISSSSQAINLFNAVFVAVSPYRVRRSS